MNWEDIDPLEMTIQIYRRKTGSMAKIALPPEAIEAIKQYANALKKTYGDKIITPDQAFCLSMPKTKRYHRPVRMTGDGLTNTVKKSLEVLGLKGRPHKLRHTAITGLIEAGAGLNVLTHISGHADIRTTMRHYSHAFEKSTNQALLLVHPINQLKRDAPW